MSRWQRSESPFAIENKCSSRRCDLKLLGPGTHFAKHRLGYLYLRQFQGVRDAYDAAVFGLDAHDRLDCQLDGLTLSVHDDRDCAAIEIHGCDDVRVCGRNVDFPEQSHGNNVRAAHSGCIAVRFGCQAKDNDLLDLRAKVPFHEAAISARNVGIEASPADVLPHFIDDQNIYFIKIQLRHLSLRKLLQHRFTGCNLRSGHDFYDRGLIMRVFHDAHAKQDITPGEIDITYFWKQHRESIHAVLVIRGCAVDLADTDRQHLGHAAFRCAAKRGVRLDAVDHHNAFRFGRKA